METTKRTIVTLDEGDTLEVRSRSGKKRILVSVDSDRHHNELTVDLPDGAQQVFDPRWNGDDELEQVPWPIHGKDRPDLMEIDLPVGLGIFI